MRRTVSPDSPRKISPPRAIAGRALACLEGERDRWILWVPVGLGMGISTYFALSFEPSWWIGIGVVCVLVAAALWVRARPAPFLALLCLLIPAIGFASAQLRAAWVAAPAVQQRLGPTGVVGRVVSVEIRESGRRVTIDRLRITRLGPDLTPDRIRLRLPAGKPDLTPGDWLRARAILMTPPPPAAPGAYDFQRRAYFEKLGGVGFSLGAPVRIADGSATGLAALPEFIAQLRQNIAARVRAALPGIEGAVAAALMTGDRGTIPRPVLENLRDSGLAHLLAISGLHIGLVAGLLFAGVRFGLALVPGVALRAPIKKWAAGVAVVGAFLYALIAGATIPTQRAFLMIGLILLAVILDRRGLSMRVVAWAATVVLLFRPESLLGASFQLSFAAVVALVAVYEKVSLGRWLQTLEPASPYRKAARYIAGVGLTTIVAGAATAPFAVYHFNQFAAFGLAANLVAVPATALWIMPWAVAVFVAMPFGLESWALAPMGHGIAVVLAVAWTVAGWPGAVTLVPAMPAAGMVLAAVGGLWLCLWQGPWRRWGAPLLVCGLLLSTLQRPPDLLINDDGRLIAARLGSGTMAVSTTRADRFDREVWLRRAGQATPPAPWPGVGADADARLTCDGLGCLYRKDGHVIALVTAPMALMEDCWVADVVVSRVPVRRSCPGARVVIDRFDLWRRGAHALWIDENAVIVRSVADERGDRPWVVRPGAQGDGGS